VDRSPATPTANQSQHHRSARNEEEDIRETLVRLLALDYSNYEVIAVNDRSTDRTGAIIDDVAASSEAHGLLKAIHIPDLPSVGSAKPTPCGRRPSRQLGLGCCSPTPTYSLSPMPCAALLPMPKLSALTTLSFSRE